MLLLGLLGGCTSMGTGPMPAGDGAAGFGVARGPVPVPGVQGPWGQPVATINPYASAPRGEQAARAMMSQSIPLDMLQMHNANGPLGGGVMQAGGPGMPGMNSGIMQASAQFGNSCPPGGCAPPLNGPAGGMLSPPGVPFAPGMPGGMPPMVAGGQMPTGAVAAIPGAVQGQGGMPFTTQRTQVRFVRPSGMKVAWYTRTPDGRDNYSPSPIEVPGRYNFLQAAVYRLKVSNIPGRPGLEIYPTLEVVPCNKRTSDFLSHSAVPIAFTDEDFKQVTSGNYVVKVVYLPDPQYQDLAFTGPDEIVSTQLEPGADPIAEAQRRGSILLVIRMGNMDQEAPNTPAINAPAPGMMMPAGQMPPNMMAGRMPPGMMPPGMRMPPNVMTPYGMGGQMPMMPTGMPNMPYPGMNPQMPGMPGMGNRPGMPPVPGTIPPPNGKTPGPISQNNGKNQDITLTSGTETPLPPPPPSTSASGGQRTLFRGSVLQTLGFGSSNANGSDCKK